MTNDIDLRQKILDELEFDPRLDAAAIGVSVRDGVATLSGRVASYAEKIAAEQATLRIKGVRGVAQEIHVVFPSDKKTGDDDLARRAIQIIDWDTTVPDTIKVKVQDGWVTLSGQVNWQFQRVNAENAVRKLSGVAGLTNQITVRPSVSAADIKTRIEDALKRNAALEAENIRVQVAGGQVSLEGRVHAWSERYAAEQAAWSAQGVTTVNDRLVVA
ncbi:MAG TPA: BON domain-containing protein [Asticcacaulis sp.]|jgi:osmotically-inducible protein OsmY|nr:BON domain-containing protein [Asticcacaulis sp.]